jgi:hypothetical protein
MTANPKSMSGCFDPMTYIPTATGLYVKYAACNSTATPAAGDMRYAIREFHFTSACDSILSTSTEQMETCKSATLYIGDTMSGNGTSVYEQQKCSGGAAVTELEIKNVYKVTFANLGTLTTPQASTVLSETCNKIKDDTQTAAGSSSGAASSVDTCVGTGDLSGGTYSRRRVRRLSAHGATTVDAVIKTLVPVAQASAVESAFATAKTSGALDPTTLAAAVVTQLKTVSSISSAVSNLTATAEVTVGTATLPTTTPGSGTSSTSGAVTEFLSIGAGFVLAAALFM